MLETCAQIQNNGAHWASQGLDIYDCCITWERYESQSSSLSKLAEVLPEKESRAFKKLYGVRESDALLDFSPSEEAPSKRR